MELSLVREDRDGRTSGAPVVRPTGTAGQLCAERINAEGI